MSGLPEAGMEQGNAYRNAVAQGMNPQEAWDKSKDDFWKNAAFLPVSNAMQYGLFGKLFGKRPFVSAVGELGSQAVEEIEQEAFQNQAAGYAGGRARRWLAPEKPADDNARTDTTQQETPSQSTKEMRSWAGKHSGGYMSDDVFDELKRASQKYGVPFEHALATAIAESHGEHFRGDGVTTSPVGALGV